MALTVNKQGSCQIDPQLCPICQKNNACMNIDCAGDGGSCWCLNLEQRFPDSLLQKIPSEFKGKACICRQCYDAALQSESVNTEGYHD